MLNERPPQDDEAEVHRLKRELNQAQDSLDWPTAAACHLLLGEALKDDHRAALRHRKEALKLYLHLHDKWGEAEARRSLGEFACIQEDPIGAIPELTAALAIYRNLGDRVGEAAIHLALGHSNCDLRDHRAAVSEYEKAVESYEDAGDQRGLALALSALGDTQRFLGNRITARLLLEDAAKAFSQLGDSHGQADAHLSLGEIENVLGNPGLSRNHYKAAMILYRDAENIQGQGRAAYAVGDLERSLGRADASRQYLEIAFRAFDKSEDHLGQMRVAFLLAELAAARGDFDTALSLSNAALGGFKDLGSLQDEANARLQYAMLEYEMGDFSAARTQLEKAIPAFTKQGDRLGEANARHLLAKVAQSTGDIATARSCTEAVLNRFKDLGDRLGEANSHLSIAEFELSCGDAAKASPHVREALVIYEKVGSSIGCAHALVTAAKIGTLAQDFTTGLQFCKAAIAIFRDSDCPIHVALASQNFSQIACVSGDLGAALDSALESVRTIEGVRSRLATSQRRETFLRSHNSIYRSGLSIATAATKENIPNAGLAALEIIETARSDALASVLRRGAHELPERAAELLRQILDIEGAIMSTYPSFGNEPGISGSRTDQAQETASAIRADLETHLSALKAELEKEVSQSFADAYIPEPVDVDGLLASLKGSHALIYDVDTSDPARYTGHVVWVPAAGEPIVSSFVIEDDELEFLGRLTAKDPALREWPHTRPYEDLAAVLLPDGLRDVIAATTEEDPLRLVIAPAGPLWALPFATLHVVGEPLVTKAVITLTPTLALRRAIMERPSAVAAPRVVAHFHPDLDGASLERDALEDLRPLLGDLIDCPRVSDIHDALAEKASCALATFPAHGDGEGLDQALLLGDGTRFSAAAALELYFGPVVVLGACWSARLDPTPGREPVALATVCLTRGAETVIGGLLAIHDLHSGTILADTYRRIARGVPAAEALRLAQRARLDERPGHWAGLVAVGL